MWNFHVAQIIYKVQPIVIKIVNLFFVLGCFTLFTKTDYSETDMEPQISWITNIVSKKKSISSWRLCTFWLLIILQIYSIFKYYVTCLMADTVFIAFNRTECRTQKYAHTYLWQWYNYTQGKESLTNDSIKTDYSHIKEGN